MGRRLRLARPSFPKACRARKPCGEKKADSSYESEFIVLASLLCFLALLAAGEEATDKAKIAATVGRKDSTIEVRREGGAVLLDVRSEFGIDTATITRRGDEWPNRMIVRLHLAGLESFRATVGETTIEWSASAEGKTRVALIGEEVETTLAEDSPYFSPARVVGLKRDDDAAATESVCFEVPLPAKLLEKNPRRIKLRWIDFYRG